MIEHYGLWHNLIHVTDPLSGIRIGCCCIYSHKYVCDYLE